MSHLYTHHVRRGRPGEHTTVGVPSQAGIHHNAVKYTSPILYSTIKSSSYTNVVRGSSTVRSCRAGSPVHKAGVPTIEIKYNIIT